MELANNIILTAHGTKLRLTYILLHSPVILYAFGTKYADVSNHNLRAISSSQCTTNSLSHVQSLNYFFFSVSTALFVFYVRSEGNQNTFLLQNGIRTNALMALVCFQKPSSHLQYHHSIQVAICCHKVMPSRLLSHEISHAL